MTNHTSPRSATEPITAPRSLDLLDGNRHVGWITGDDIGFRGFADATQAVHAAWVAHRALARRLGAPATWSEPETFAIARHADRETILVDGDPIAVLVRPGADDPSGSDSFGFEIRIPERADEIFPRAMAYRMYLALRKSGTAWALWQTTSTHDTGVPEDRRSITDPTVASMNETTLNEGGDSDVSDEFRQRAHRYLPPQWGRGRRTRTREREEHRVRRLREPR